MKCPGCGQEIKTEICPNCLYTLRPLNENVRLESAEKWIAKDSKKLKGLDHFFYHLSDRRLIQEHGESTSDVERIKAKFKNEHKDLIVKEICVEEVPVEQAAYEDQYELENETAADDYEIYSEPDVPVETEDPVIVEETAESEDYTLDVPDAGPESEPEPEVVEPIANENAVDPFSMEIHSDAHECIPLSKETKRKVKSLYVKNSVNKKSSDGITEFLIGDEFVEGKKDSEIKRKGNVFKRKAQSFDEVDIYYDDFFEEIPRRKSHSMKLSGFNKTQGLAIAGICLTIVVCVGVLFAKFGGLI